MKRISAFVGVLLFIASCQKEVEKLGSPVIKPSLKSTSLDFDLPAEVNPDGLSSSQADTTVTLSVIYYKDSITLDTVTYSYSYSGINLIGLKVDSETADYFGLGSSNIMDEFQSECISNWEDSYGKVSAKSKFGKWLEKVFIGTKFKNGPCLMGQQDWCRDHWLVGVYGCRIEDC